jgi:hypothetical protein
VDFTADDMYGGQFYNQYTNFNSQTVSYPRESQYQRHPLLPQPPKKFVGYNNKIGQNKPIRLSPQPVVELPEDLKTDDYIIGPDK